MTEQSKWPKWCFGIVINFSLWLLNGDSAITRITVLLSSRIVSVIVYLIQLLVTFLAFILARCSVWISLCVRKLLDSLREYSRIARGGVVILIVITRNANTDLATNYIFVMPNTRRFHVIKFSHTIWNVSPLWTY